MPSPTPPTYVTIDIETTGLNWATDHIIEIACIRTTHNRITDTYQTLVQPGYLITDHTTHLTGITNQMLTDAPRIDTILDTVTAFIGNSVIVGHNLAFDLNFLNCALIRHRRQPLRNKMIDTLAASRQLVTKTEVANYKLTTLTQHFGLSINAHRALADAYATTYLLHALFARAGINHR